MCFGNNSVHQNNYEHIEKQINGLTISYLETSKNLIGKRKVTEGKEIFDASITVEKDDRISIFYDSSVSINGKLVKENGVYSIIGTKSFDATS